MNCPDINARNHTLAAQRLRSTIKAVLLRSPRSGRSQQLQHWLNKPGIPKSTPAGAPARRLWRLCLPHWRRGLKVDEICLLGSPNARAAPEGSYSQVARPRMCQGAESSWTAGGIARQGIVWATVGLMDGIRHEMVRHLQSRVGGRCPNITPRLAWIYFPQ